jgi:hypothetical protein
VVVHANAGNVALECGANHRGDAVAHTPNVHASPAVGDNGRNATPSAGDRMLRPNDRLPPGLPVAARKPSRDKFAVGEVPVIA